MSIQSTSQSDVLKCTHSPTAVTPRPTARLFAHLSHFLKAHGFGWAVYLTLFLVFVAITLSLSPLQSKTAVIMPLGLIASWRYGWQTIHFLRAERYKHRVFPKWRRKADRIAADPASSPEHIGVVITSYRMSAVENFEVYSALFQELKAFGAPATVVASVTDDGDARLIHQIFETALMPAQIDLVTQLQLGTGKRDAMSTALRALRVAADTADGIVILMDGDTVVPRGVFERTCSFFRLMPDVAALTINNRAVVRGGSFARTWYAMRFALRNLYMSSLSLSLRVLCLTGRFSMFRATVAYDPRFIRRIERDTLNHWRLGQLQMLTGDDKSTWYHCLKDGWAMIYLPDTYVTCLEELPKGGFLTASAKLMQRWFGNMLRNSDRSIALGPKRMGLFTWWCLVDQRLSMWTSLTGLLFLTFFLVRGELVALPAYLAIIMFTRAIQTLNVAHQGGIPSPLVPLLLLHQQIIGSLIKIEVLFHLNRQKWTRQDITSGSLSRAGRVHAMQGDWLKIAVVFVFCSSMIAFAAMTSSHV